MGSHARLSPSSAHRWVRCAASVMMCEGLPDSTSVYAAEGTVAHTILETCGRDGVDPLTYLDQVFTEDGFQIKVDMEMVEAVRQTIAYVDSVKMFYPDAQVYWERKVDCGAFFNRTDCTGTVDITIVILRIRYLETIDFKYGKGQIVEVKDNEQLDLYSIGSLIAFDPDAGKLSVDQHPFDTYKTTIVQPRSSVNDGLSVSTVQTAKEIMHKANTFYHAGLATDEPTAPFSPSKEACKWCAFKKGDPNNGVGPCKAAVDSGLKSTGMIFTPIDSQENLPVELEKNAVVRPESLTEEQQIAILDNGALMKALIDDVSAYCAKRAIEGHRYPHHKLVEGTTRRKWDPDLSEEDIIKKLSGFKIKKVESTKTVLRTPRQIEDLSKKLDLSASRRKNLQKMIIKPKGALTLVPESDLRKDAAPAIVFDPIPPAGKVTEEPETKKSNPMG